MSVVGENVKRYRIAAGLSQAELSQMSGTTQPQVSAVERGAVSPMIETLEKIAEALGVTLVDLVSEPAPKARTSQGEGSARTSGAKLITESAKDSQGEIVDLIRPIVTEAVREVLAERARALEHRQ